MLNRDTPPDKFFDAWLARVDELCMRFLDIDLASIPEAQHEPYHPDHAYGLNLDPETYFLTLLNVMKDTSPEDEDGIDRQFARMVKWGTERP